HTDDQRHAHSDTSIRSRQARRPAKPNVTSAAISNSAVNQEKAVTCGATALPVYGSLNAPQCGTRWAAAKPAALMNPTYAANSPAARSPRNTRTTATAAATN